MLVFGEDTRVFLNIFTTFILMHKSTEQSRDIFFFCKSPATVFQFSWDVLENIFCYIFCFIFPLDFGYNEWPSSKQRIDARGQSGCASMFC